MILFCSSCDWRKVIPPSDVANEGTEVTLDQSDLNCPDCSSKTKIASSIVHVEASYSDEDKYVGPPGELNIDISEWADEIELQEDVTLSTYVNRVVPLVVVARIIADIEYRDKFGETSHRELIDYLDKAGVELRKLFEQVEERTMKETGSEINVGQRASLGFPKDDETARRRFLRSYIGGNLGDDSLGATMNHDGDLLVNADGEVEFHGEMQKLGLMQVTSDGKIELTDRTKVMMSIDPLPRRNTVEIEAHEIGEYVIEAPKWFEDLDSRELAKAIAAASEREMHWMERIMTRIRNSHCDHGDLAKAEVKRIIMGDQVCCDHWEIEIPVSLTDEEEKRLERRIYRDLSSTLGRMRELRLILPVKRGRRISYRVSRGIGMPLLNKWREALEPREDA